MTVIEENVTRGAALLDSVAPNWHYQVDRELLSMTSCTHCVLGQLFEPAYQASEGEAFTTWANGTDERLLNGFDIGKVVLGAPYTSFPENDHWSWEHGFIADISTEVAYGELRNTWLKAIADREPF